MNRITAIALYMTLTAVTGMSAHAQPASSPGAKTYQTQRVQPVIRCAHLDSGSQALQPCRARRATEATHLGHAMTRQEFECVLSGVCGVTDRTQVQVASSETK